MNLIMSVKNCDHKGRWRNVYVGFRISPEESEMLNKIISLTGQTKQDYLISRILNRDIIVRPNPRVYKALQNEIKNIYDELKKISNTTELSEEFLFTLHLFAKICDGLKGDSYE